MKPGERYKHFKGTLYEIVLISKDSETQEELVTYRQADNPEKIWTRSKAMFLEEVDKPEYNYRGPRFKFIT